MYAILSGGALLALCDKPRYVRFNPKSGAYVESGADDAEAVAVNGELYSLPGRAAIEGRPEALVVERESAEYVFQNKMQIAANEARSEAAFTTVEGALCEQDTASDRRLSALENAICELDMIMTKEAGA